MDALATVTAQPADGNSAQDRTVSDDLSAPAPPQAVGFHYTQTDSFVALLHQLGASLLVSTYQANKLLAVRASGNGLSTLVRTFDKPMGLAVNARRLAIGTRTEVWFLRNAPDRPAPSNHGVRLTDCSGVHSRLAGPG